MEELLTRDEILEIADKTFDKQNFSLIKYSITKRSENNLGYLGNHLTLVITGLLNDERINKSFFIKTFPDELLMQEDFVRATGMLEKEADIYRKLFQNMENLGKIQNWSPKYIFSNSKVLVLEDLSCEDYHMVCEKLILDEEHLELALKSLSAMHASSLILEEKKGTHLDKIYPDIFKEIMFDENNLEAPTRRWLLKGINDLQVGVDHLQKYTLSEKILIKKKLPQILMKIYPLSKKSQRYTNVLVHGDMWRNNILFRHEEGKPIDCKLVDYQFARYAPPAHDVMQLLHLTTAKEFRNTHEKRLLHYYHDRLRENLQKHDYDIDKTYPWNVFNECCQHYKLLALIQSILSLHYLLGPADQKVDSILTSPKEYDEYMSKHREIYMKKYFNDPNYEKKISEIYHEIIRNFIL